MVRKNAKRKSSKEEELSWWKQTTASKTSIKLFLPYPERSNVRTCERIRETLWKFKRKPGLLSLRP